MVANIDPVNNSSYSHFDMKADIFYVDVLHLNTDTVNWGASGLSATIVPDGFVCGVDDPINYVKDGFMYNDPDCKQNEICFDIFKDEDYTATQPGAWRLAWDTKDFDSGGDNGEFAPPASFTIYFGACNEPTASYTIHYPDDFRFKPSFNHNNVDDGIPQTQERGYVADHARCS